MTGKPSAAKRAAVWLARCRHRSGFGIQSPWAYSFVRRVVCCGSGCSAPLGVKLCRLYGRMADGYAPGLWIDLTADRAQEVERSVGGMCRYSLCGSMPATGGAHFAARADAAATPPEEIAKAAGAATEHSVLILENIKGSAKARRVWSETAGHGRARASFDLYWCGIVFFNPKRARETHIVNFF